MQLKVISFKEIPQHLSLDLDCNYANRWRQKIKDQIASWSDYILQSMIQVAPYSEEILCFCLEEYNRRISLPAKDGEFHNRLKELSKEFISWRVDRELRRAIYFIENEKRATYDDQLML